jgi:hypothetical protein
MKIDNSLFYAQVVHANIISLTNNIYVMGYYAMKLFYIWGFIQHQHRATLDATIHDIETLTQE